MVYEIILLFIRSFSILVYSRFSKDERTNRMSEENKNMQQSKPQSTEKPAAPFGNLRPAAIPTKMHTYTYNGKSEKMDNNDD